MSDIFEELLTLLHPDRLLRDPRATGEGVRVCVIDSGIERALLEERFRTRGQEIEPIEGAVFVQGRAEPLPYDGRQSAPHGTTVADILLTLAPRVRLYSADVFGQRGTNCLGYIKLPDDFHGRISRRGAPDCPDAVAGVASFPSIGLLPFNQAITYAALAEF